MEYLLEHFEKLFDYTYTKDMEDKLDEIINIPDVDSGIIQKVCSEYYVNVTSNISNDKKDSKIRSLSDGDLGVNQSSRCLGLVNNNTCVYIKKGRYGTYVEWKNEIGEVCRVSVSNIVGNRPLENIILSEIEPFLNLSEKSEKSEKKQGFVRLVTKNITIHYGKYGYYIQFKTPVMKKARLYNLNGFTNDVLTCNVTTLKKWISEKYNIF
jgi:topoisomerase IA-like protein